MGAGSGFLQGLIQGTGNELNAARERTRVQEERAITHRQGFEKFVMEGLLSGRVRPEVGGSILQELAGLDQPRKNVGGWKGLMGHTQMPQTPQLDRMLGPGFQGAVYSPDEFAQQEAQRRSEAAFLEDQNSFSNKARMAPQFIEMLVTQYGIPKEMAQAAVVRHLHGADFGGVKGQPGDWWNPVTKEKFRAYKDPIRGVVNSDTNEVVTAAGVYPIDAQYLTDRFTGDQILYDQNKNQELVRTKMMTAAPLQGSIFSHLDPAGNPVFVPAQGLQQPAPPTTPAPVVNPEFEKLEKDITDVERLAKASWDLYLSTWKEANSHLLINKSPEQLNQILAPLERIRLAYLDTEAKRARYESYQAMLDARRGQPTRQQRVPAQGVQPNAPPAPNAAPAEPAPVVSTGPANTGTGQGKVPPGIQIVPR